MADWTKDIPADMKSAPGAFFGFLARINACLGAARALANMKGIGGVKVKVSDSNIVIEGSGGSGGLPQGYGPEEFTICEDGAPVARKFITNNPDV